MRWLRCSYPDLQQLPDGYVEMAAELARKDAAAARAAQRGRR